MIFQIPLKRCCGAVLINEVCDCAAFAAEAAQLFANPLILRPATRPAAEAAPSTTYPKPLVLRNIGGLMRRVEDAS